MHVVFDRAAALAVVEGDAELLAEQAGLFIADGPRLLAEVQEAAARSDSQALERTAQTLKGSVSAFAASAAVAAASGSGPVSARRGGGSEARCRKILSRSESWRAGATKLC
jgi:hypothetical protein